MRRYWQKNRNNQTLIKTIDFAAFLLSLEGHIVLMVPLHDYEIKTIIQNPEEQTKFQLENAATAI